MKKIILLALLMMAISLGFAATYQIGNGETVQDAVPLYCMARYSWSRSLYTASEIHAAGLTTSANIAYLSYNISSTSRYGIMSSQKIYMRHTTETQIPQSTTVENSGFTLVYDGDNLFYDSGWHHVPLDFPFQYDGVSGIEIIWENHFGTSAPYPYYFKATLTPDKTVCAVQNGSFPTSQTTVTHENERPDIMLSTAASAIPEPAQVFHPLNGYTTEGDSATIQWLYADSYVEGCDFYFGTTNPPPFVASLDKKYSYTADNLQTNTTYYWKVVPRNSIGENTSVPTWHFVSKPLHLSVIGNGIGKGLTPVSCDFHYTYSQSLYLADQINKDARPLEKIAYEWNGGGTAANSNEWTIYIGHTNKTVFEDDNDWVAFDDLVQVYQGTLDIPAVQQWVDIQLDTQFAYNGTDNLVIAVLESKPQGDGSAQYFFNTVGIHARRSISTVSSSTILDPASPFAGTTREMYPNIKMHFVDMPTNPVVSVSPKNIDFGDVLFEATSDTREIKLINSGAGTLNLNATNFAFTGANADLFSIDESVFPIALNYAQTAQIPISLVGSISGDISVNLNITYGGTTNTVLLRAKVLPGGLVTIGNGRDNGGMPVDCNFYYTYSQSLYMASEIDKGARLLEKIAYQYNGAGPADNSDEWTVYIGHTSKTEFESITDWVSVNEMTHVFEGTVNIPAIEQWVEIVFDTPFQYNGRDNLVIAVGDTSSDRDSSNLYFYNTSSTNSRSHRVQSYNLGTNPANPSNGELVNMYPNIQMYFGDIPPYPIIDIAPENIDFGTISYNQTSDIRYVNIINTGAGTLNLSATAFELTGTNIDLLSIDESIFPIALNYDQLTQIPISLVGSRAGDVSASLDITYDGATTTVSLVGRVLSEGFMTIGDGRVNGKLPISCNDNYTYSQSLYPASEINRDACVLDKIAYHYNGAGPATNSNDWTVYIGHTSKTEFVSTSDWVPVNNMTQVFQGILDIPAVEQWIEIVLDTPFTYNGVDNLVIAVRETKPSYNSNKLYFYNTSSTDNRSLRTQSNTISINPANPANGELVAMYPNIQLSFGGMPPYPIGVLTPNNTNFSISFFGAMSETKYITLKNIGIGTLELSAANFGFTGANANLFSIDESVFPITLANAETVQIPVSYVGTVSGEVSAFLELNYDVYTTKVALKGSVYPKGMFFFGNTAETTASTFPFSAYYGHGRSASLYKSSEIWNTGELTSIGWDCTLARPLIIPYKIYVGMTDADALPSIPFDTLIQELTLVAEGETAFNDLGWNMFDLTTPFLYVGGNLIVAVETNYGGNGNLHGPLFRYTTSDTDSHQTWGSYYDSPPTRVSLNANRPNCMVNITTKSGRPVLAVNPDTEYTYPTTELGDTAQKTFAIANVGDGTINITEISITGTSFSLASEFTPLSIDSGEAYQFTVIYNPPNAGDHTANLVISTSVGHHIVELSGSCLDIIIRSFPYMEDFGSAEPPNLPTGWTLLNPDNTNVFWQSFINDSYSPPRCVRINYTGNNDGPLNDWFITPPIAMEAGKGYRISYYYRAYGFSKIEKLALCVGEAPTAEAMTTILIDHDGFNHRIYQKATVEFTPTIDGVYYFGWYAYSDANQLAISVDDVKIDYSYIAESSVAADLGSGVSVTINGDGFIGAFEVPTLPENLTPIPNPAFISINHQLWQLRGNGIVSLTFTNSGSEDMWLAYVSGGAWIAHELLPGTSVDITIDLDAKDASFEFALGGGSNPTLPVELSYFNAIYMADESRVKLSWKTESESQMLGYQVYRSADDNLANASLITGKIVEALNSSSGDSYSFVDSDIAEGTHYYWLEAVSYNSSSFYGHINVLVEAEEEPDPTPEIPEISSMSRAYPNPFKDVTTIDIVIKSGETGSFAIYNLLGQLVYSKKLDEGKFTIKWDGKDKSGNHCASGIYLYKLITPNKYETKKMVIIK